MKLNQAVQIKSVNDYERALIKVFVVMQEMRFEMKRVEGGRDGDRKLPKR